LLQVVSVFTDERSSPPYSTSIGVWKKTMSDIKHSDTIIKNEDTIQRRAWIDRAVASAKDCAGSDHSQGAPQETAAKPDLYLVRSNGTQ